MSQYIVDASIAVQLVIEDAHTAETKALFKEIERGDKLIMPEFGLLECTNVLWKQVRFNDVPPAKTIRHTQDLQELDLVIVPVVGLLPRALEIGLEHQLAVYDSAYIALAKQMGHPLITDDSRQAKAAQAEGVSLKAITDFQ